MEEKDLIKNLKNIKYKPSKEADDRISWMLMNSYENEKNSVTDLNNESKNNQNNLFFSLQKMKLKTLALIGTPVVAVGALSVIGAMYVLPLLSPTSVPMVPNDTLTAQQKQEIYKSILANNSQMQSVSQSENYALSERSENTSGDAAATVMPTEKRLMPVPGDVQDTDKKLVKTTYATTNGPKSNACKAYSGGMAYNPDKTESISYYDSKGYSVYGMIEYIGDVQFISLSKYTPTGSETYDYKGGKYAIKTVYKYDATNGDPSFVGAPVMEKLELTDVPESNNENTNTPEGSIDEQIKIYFGEDTDIIGTETIDGKEYYVLQYSYDTRCDISNTYLSPDFWNGESYEDVYSKENPDHVIIRNYIGTEGYAIYKSDTYLEKVDASNLISSYITTSTYENSSYEEAIAEITIDPAIPVKEINQDDQPVYAYDYKTEITYTLDYIEKSGYPVTSDIAAGYVINSVGSNNYYSQIAFGEFTDLYSNRDFYPEGALGDRIYKDWTAIAVPVETDYPVSLASYGFKGKDESGLDTYGLFVDVYKNSFDNMKIVNSVIYNPVKEKSIEEVQIKFDGSVATAKIYKYQTEYEAYGVVDSGMIDPATGNKPVSNSVDSYNPASEKLMIDPMPSEGVEMIESKDSGYIMILGIGEYKIVIYDTNYGSSEYPESLDKIMANGIKTTVLNTATKAKIAKQIIDSMEQVDGPVNIMPYPAAGSKEGSAL
jgi:hypothetical protein